MKRTKIEGTAAMALLAVLTLSQAPLVLGDNPTVDNDIKFGLGAHGTKVSFSENMVTDSITLASENITIENLKMASGNYIATSQFISIENADLNLTGLENENVAFTLTAVGGAENAMSILSSDNRNPVKPHTTTENGIRLEENTSLAALQASDNGWYFDNSDNLLYVKTSTNASVFVNWISGTPTCAITAPPNEYEVMREVEVQFTSTASDPDNDPLTYAWTFGDGATSSESDPTHTYGGTGGDFIVTLIVSDWINTATSSITIDVKMPGGTLLPLPPENENPAPEAPAATETNIFLRQIFGIPLLVILVGVGAVLFIKFKIQGLVFLFVIVLFLLSV